MFNQITLIGHVGNPPETRDASGTQITKFSVATNKRWKDKSGNPQEETQWHNVVTFGRLAEIVAQYVGKGSRVFVQGELRHNKYEKDGETKYFTEVAAQTVNFLDRKGESDNGSGAKYHNSGASSGGNYAPPSSNVDDDDIPF